MPNIVDLATGQPVAADALARARRASRINQEIAQELHEVDADKLLSYFAALLPVDDCEWQIQYVLDRRARLEDCAAMLLAEAEPSAQCFRAPWPSPSR
jgi:hypothetical protein